MANIAILAFLFAAWSSPSFAMPQKAQVKCEPLMFSLTPEMLGKFRDHALDADVALKLEREKLRNEGLQGVLNEEIVKSHNDRYTSEVDMGPIDNQKRSGICWIESGVHWFREAALARGILKKGANISKSYLLFHAANEKFNMFLNQVADGVLSDSVGTSDLTNLKSPSEGFDAAVDVQQLIQIIDKWGLAPESAMPDKYFLQNDGKLIQDLDLLATKVKEDLMGLRQKGLSPAKLRDDLSKRLLIANGEAYAMLVSTLGIPPTSFAAPVLKSSKEVSGKTVRRYEMSQMSPLDYAQMVRTAIPENNLGYVTVTSNPNLPYGKAYRIENSALAVQSKGDSRDYNIRYLNVPSEQMLEMVKASIDVKVPAWLALDAEHLEYDIKTGIAHPNIYLRNEAYGIRDINLRREVLYKNLNITPDHGVIITAADKPDGAKHIIKVKIENSWGKWKYKKPLAMYRESFLLNAYSIIVPRIIFTKDQLKKFDNPLTIPLNGLSTP